jgi:hypothetical protein
MTVSCGCLHHGINRPIEPGRQYGRLIAIDVAGRDSHRHVLWACICTCGKEVRVRASKLRNGATLSCGCLQAESGGGVPWHDFLCSSNNVMIRVQGSYELAVVKLLDFRGVGFIAHPLPGWPWIDANGKGHTYFPDLYIPERDTYYDTKNPYVEEKDAEKIRRVKECNPGRRLVVLGAELLWDIGIVKRGKVMDVP